MVVNHRILLPMTATQTIQIRVPVEQAKLLRRAARVRGIKLATFVREASVASAAEVVLRGSQDLVRTAQ